MDDALTVEDEAGNLIAIVIPGTASVPAGISFLTSHEVSQQLGAMSRPSGYHVSPHRHSPTRRVIEDTCETLFVRKGLVAVALYDREEKFLREVILGSGSVVTLLAGGHGLLFLEETEVIEVKQGPYVDDKRFLAT